MPIMDGTPEQVEQFFSEQRKEREWRESQIREAVAKERERCAKICDNLALAADSVKRNCLEESEDFWEGRILSAMWGCRADGYWKAAKMIRVTDDSR